MVILNSYVKLPEGILKLAVSPPQKSPSLRFFTSLRLFGDLELAAKQRLVSC